MKRYLYILVISASSFFFSCTTMLPMNNHYEKAGTLQKGNVEVAGHVTRYDVHHYGRQEKSHDNYGFRAGVGLTNRFDVKLRYEKMQFTRNFDESIRRADYFSFIPKLAIVPEYFSLLVPISTFKVHSASDGYRYSKRVNSIAPQLIYTYTNRKKTIDLSLSSKLDLLFEADHDPESVMFFGFTAGAGFSKDLSRWSVRPEIGFSSEIGEAQFLSYGLGFQWIIPTRKRK